MSMRDGWRLSVGTLTAIPIRPPVTVDRATSRTAMLLAPVVVLPLGLLVAALLWLAERADLPYLAAGFVAVGALALGSRALHLDGLSDTVDGLTASYDRERALAVMRSGSAGPAGVVALVVVLGTQAAALASLAHNPRAALLAGALVCVSRCALSLTCLAGVPAARPDGIGAPSSGVVPVPLAVVSWLLGAAAVAGLGAWAGVDWWRCVLAVAAAAILVGLVIRTAIRRIGGVTGDVYGAAIELALAALLIGCAG